MRLPPEVLQGDCAERLRGLSPRGQPYRHQPDRYFHGSPWRTRWSHWYG